MHLAVGAVAVSPLFVATAIISIGFLSAAVVRKFSQTENLAEFSLIILKNFPKIPRLSTTSPVDMERKKKAAAAAVSAPGRENLSISLSVSN